MDDFRDCVFQVKFDTLREKRYEEITRVAGSFKWFINGVNRLSESGVRYYFQAALTPRDIDCLDGMVDFALEKRASKIKFGPVIPTARGKSVPWQFSKTEAKDLLERLKRLRERYGNIVDWKETAIALGMHEEPNPEAHPITDCKATRCYMRLTYDRKAVPCNSTREMCIGSYAPGHLRAIWNGAAVAGLRASGFVCPLRELQNFQSA
jgi:MoaA/NifB/PqqE/SkfB family radical SAM enzyme